MWKNGQLVTLWENVYRIHKTQYFGGYQACMFCQKCNVKPPCINGFDYPEKHGFDLRSCRLNVPDGSIPKILKPKK